MLNKSVITLFGINLYYMDILLIITILLHASVALIIYDKNLFREEDFINDSMVRKYG